MAQALDDERDDDTVHAHLRRTLQQQRAKPRHWAEYIWGKADAVATLALAASIAWFGNGTHPTWHLLRHHEGVNREALLAAGLLALVNFGVFVYVQVRVRWLQGVREDPELAPEWALHVATPCGALAVILFIWACWGVFGWVSIPIAYLYLFAFVMSMHFVPNVVGYRDAKASAVKSS